MGKSKHSGRYTALAHSARRVARHYEALARSAVDPAARESAGIRAQRWLLHAANLGLCADGTMPVRDKLLSWKQ